MSSWEIFFKEKVSKIFNEKKSVIDIGGGLRAAKERGNRYSANQWMAPLIQKVDYKILDPAPTYNPDIVGDIHKLPFQDNSQDAILCLSILEHVENPILATQEMYRVLRSDGYCFVYVPFLYYYHAEKGYYGDYWRFTKDTIDLLFKNFSSVEVQSVRGAAETWIHLSPLGRIKIIRYFAGLIDKISGKITSSQVSGYYVFLIK